MKISAVLLARVLAFFDTAELNPRGEVSLPNLVPHIVQRFSFTGSPPNTIDPENPKSILFKGGFFEGQAIEEFALYGDGAKLDLRSSTDDARRLLLSSFAWLAKEFKLNFSEQMVSRWGYLSQIVFTSEHDLCAIHPALTQLSAEVSELVDKRMGANLKYQPSGLSLSFEHVLADFQVSNFTIDRRARTAYSKQKYFSQAPLETKDHVRLLEAFEKNLSKAL